MNILLINHYAGSPELGMEFRPYYMAGEWQKKGHSVLIVGATYSHLRKVQPETFGKQMIDGIQYHWIKTNTYKGNGAKRVASMLIFIYKLLCTYKKICRHFIPDVVIASSTYPLDNYPARKIAQHYRAKYIYEVHDLWPLSPMELGGMSKYHPFIAMMQIAENYAYKHVDAVVSMLPKAYPHMKQHGLSEKKFFCVPNGIVLEDWYSSEPLPQTYHDFFDTIKKQYKFILGYVGGHALSNSLDILLDVAKQIANKQIAVVLIGNGVEKEHLQQRKQKEKIENTYFLNAVSKKQIPELLSKMDGLYIGWTRNTLYQYGISPNKIFDYAMSGKPIVHAVDAGNDLVKEARCGISVEPDNIQKIAEAILTLSNMSLQEREQLGANGCDFVVKNHTYDVLADHFIQIIKSIQ